MDTTTDDIGLVYAFVLDGAGGGTALDWAGVRDWDPNQGTLWVHLDYAQEGARAWLASHSGLDSLVAEALAAGETRPRCTSVNGGLLISLRGVNTNPGSEPEDMVAIRLFATANRVVTTRHRRLLAAADLAEALCAGTGPRTSGELLTVLADCLIGRMISVITDLDDRMDALEEAIFAGGGQEIRSGLIKLRQEVIMLRRYLAPQREALTRLQAESMAWLGGAERLHVRETTDTLTRYVEDLDAIKDRAGVASEELSSRLAEQINSRMYRLSLVAGLFLPLGFLTGLLGINVGGIPLAEDTWGFAAVLGLLVLVGLGQLVWFRHKRWF